MKMKMVMLALALSGWAKEFALHVHSDEVRMDDMTKRLQGLAARSIDPPKLDGILTDHKTRLEKLEARVFPTPSPTPAK